MKQKTKTAKRKARQQAAAAAFKKAGKRNPYQITTPFHYLPEQVKQKIVETYG